MDAFDMFVIGLLKKLILLIPYANTTFEGIPIGIYTYSMVLTYCAGEIYTMLGKIKKGVKK